MNDKMSIVQLVMQATPLVWGVLLLLALASILSWTIMLAKRSLLSSTQSAAIAFENRFWSGGTLGDLYESLRRGREKAGEGLANVFCAGYEEFTRQQGQHIDPDDALAAVQRQMRVAQTREVERLEGGLSMLATIGSTSPYVGLFGTVWGIMHAFINIGANKQATLAQVAPGIAEALIATAFGLFAAIPAMIAYNFFTSRVDRLESRFSTFADEMTGIIERGLRGAAGSRAQ